MIGAAEEQPTILRPPHVVIRPLDVPQHHVAEAQSPSRDRTDLVGREDIRVTQPKSSGERTEVTRRIAGCDHDLLRVDRAVRRIQPDTVAHPPDAGDFRSLEDTRSVIGSRSDQAKTCPQRIQLRVSASPDRAGAVEAGDAT